MQTNLTKEQFDKISAAFVAKYHQDPETRQTYFGQCSTDECTALANKDEYSSDKEHYLKYYRVAPYEVRMWVSFSPLTSEMTLLRAGRLCKVYAIANVTQTQVCDLTSKHVPYHRTYFLTKEMWDEIFAIVFPETVVEFEILPAHLVNHNYVLCDEHIHPHKKNYYRKPVRDSLGTLYILEAEAHDMSDKTKFPGSPKKFIYTIKASLSQPDDLEDFQASFTIGMSQDPYSIKRIENSIAKLWQDLNCSHSSYK